LDQAADVVADDLAENLVDHRDIGLAVLAPNIVGAEQAQAFPRNSLSRIQIDFPETD
jgi:hypothetical protein